MKHAVAKDVELSLLCALLDPMEFIMAGTAGTGCVETCSISLDSGSPVHHFGFPRSMFTTASHAGWPWGNLGSYLPFVPQEEDE